LSIALDNSPHKPQGKPFVGELLGRGDFAIIGEIVEANTRVLDLGCGEAELLAWLIEHKNVEARGVEISPAKVRKAIARGVKIAVGTDAAVYPHGKNAGELVRLVELGMTPVNALKAGTSVDADLLGISEKTGTLEVGKFADVIAVAGNPEQDIRAVQKVTFVMKEGKVYKRPGQ